MDPHLQQAYYHGPVLSQQGPVRHHFHSGHEPLELSTPLDDFSAAEVLASFNKYPIRATAPDSTQGLTHSAASSDSEARDPLLADIQSVAGELKSALPSVLAKRQYPDDEDASCDLNLSYCRGALGTGGSLVPDKPDQDPGLSYATPAASPVTTHQPEPMTKREPQPSPAAGDQGFKTSFQFVVNEDAKEARNTVRKHVMREYRRRERWEQDKKQAASETAQGPSRPNLKRRRKSSKPSTGSDTSLSEEGHFASPQSSESGGMVPSSGMTEAALIFPTKKKRRFMPPVFAESRQSQLWGAVTFDYENAVAELKGKKTLPYQSDPWAAVAPSEIDPFSRLNCELGPATRSLLHHFAWVMPSLMDEIVTGKVFHRIGWLYSSVAVHDPTPAHVILGFTLGHIAHLRGIEEPPMAIEHKAKALKLITARMSDPDQATSDGSIGAIVNIAGYELVDSNPKAFAMHMSGLRRIVMARGGMSSLRNNRDLETVLVRLDAIRAYIAISAPRYPKYTFVRSMEPLAIDIPRRTPYPSPNTIPNTTIFEASIHSNYCSDALQLLHDLEDVLLLARSAATDITGPLGPPVRVLLSAAVAQLLTIPGPSLSSSSSPILQSQGSTKRSKMATASRCLRLAALAFLDTAMREFFDSPNKPGDFIAKLQSRFLGEATAHHMLAPSTPLGKSIEMMLAVLLQADRMALERPYRGWYFADALTLTMGLSEETWAMAAVGLMRYLANEGGQEIVVGSRSATVWDLEAALREFSKEWDGTGDVRW